MSRPELCVGGVAVQDGRLLLVQRDTEPGAGLWSLPGGRVELGETMTEAVEREVREETGLDVTVLDIMGWVERIGSQHHFVIADFHVVVDGLPTPHAGDDAREARWVPLTAVRELPLVEGMIEFLENHGVLTPR